MNRLVAATARFAPTQVVHRFPVFRARSQRKTFPSEQAAHRISAHNVQEIIHDSPSSASHACRAAAGRRRRADRRSAAHADPPAPTDVPTPSVPPDSSDVGAAIVATMDDEDDGAPQTTPPDAWIAPDGALRLDGGFTGVVDLSGWHVTLDPERGPVFHPQSLTWDHLGTRPGAINRQVSAVAVSGTDIYVGGDFTDAGGNPNADYIARWDGSAWHPLGGGVNEAVRAIAVSGGNVYVGGFFTDAGGNPNADGIGRASLLKKAYLPLIVR